MNPAEQKKQKRKEKKKQCAADRPDACDALLMLNSTLFILLLLCFSDRGAIHVIKKTDRLPPIRSCIFPGLASNP